MYEYDDECIRTFLEKQLQLFPEIVAETPEDAEEFLIDCMAVVCQNKQEVIDYMADGMDIAGMSEDEILDAQEVFPLSNGRYLVVEA